MIIIIGRHRYILITLLRTNCLKFILLIINFTHIEMGRVLEGFSGAHLKEYVRLALLERTKEVLSQNRKGGPTSSSSTLPNVSVSAYKFKNARPLNKKDFEKAYAKLYASNAFQNDTSGEDSREQQQNMTAFDELISKMIQGMAEQNNNSSQNGKKGPEVDVEID